MHDDNQTLEKLLVVDWKSCKNRYALPESELENKRVTYFKCCKELDIYAVYLFGLRSNLCFCVLRIGVFVFSKSDEIKLFYLNAILKDKIFDESSMIFNYKNN